MKSLKFLFALLAFLILLTIGSTSLMAGVDTRQRLYELYRFEEKYLSP